MYLTKIVVYSRGIDVNKIDFEKELLYFIEVEVGLII
jgi:hypothetical protein